MSAALQLKDLSHTCHLRPEWNACHSVTSLLVFVPELGEAVEQDKVCRRQQLIFFFYFSLGGKCWKENNLEDDSYF